MSRHNTWIVFLAAGLVTLSSCKVEIASDLFSDKNENPSPTPVATATPQATATPKPTAVPNTPTPAPTQPPVVSSPTCGNANEGGSIQLSCDNGKVITAVNFASYGTPQGSCGSATVSSCHASSSKSVVEAGCLGKSSCMVSALNSAFGDPCMNVSKKLIVSISCGTQASTPTPTATPKPTVAPTVAPTSTPAGSPSGNALIWYDNAEQLPQVSWGIDFRKGYSMWTGGTQNLSNQDSRNTMRVSTSYARKGKSSYHARVEKRMDYPSCCQWTRSEFMWMAPSQQTSQNVWRWASISTLIPESFKFENRPVLIAYDHKASPDDYKTPFGLVIENGKYKIGGYGFNDHFIGPVIKGQWEDWVLERNFEDNSSGFIRFYRNGVKIWEHYGPNYRRNSGDAPVPRIQHGLYKWVWATSNGQGWGEGTPIDAAVAPIEMYMDEIRFGDANNKLEDFLIK